MRSPDEYRRILRLWEEGMNKSEIEQITKIPRATIRDCIKRYGNLETLEIKTQEEAIPRLLQILCTQVSGEYTKIHAQYAYLLGLYLGDGHVVKMRRVYRLRIFLDYKYPNIITSCSQAMQTLFPENQIGQAVKENNGKPSMVTVSLYYKYLPLFFPQHGEGEKHTRPIILEQWQQKIVDQHSLEFFRGLYHSDGSRSRNIVNGKDYPRYSFTNTSNDIIKIFCDTCDRLGVHWTPKFFKSKDSKHQDRWDIFISKRPDVAYLDSVIGAKT